MKRALSLMALTLTLAAVPVQAAEMMTHGAMRGVDCKMKGMFLTKKTIDGYTVSFHVMKPQAGQTTGGSRDFMVKVEKDGQVQHDLLVNSKVESPDKASASKMMMKMGDWYMAAYDMDRHGRYRLMVLFKTPDGSKHFGGVVYPAP